MKVVWHLESARINGSGNELLIYSGPICHPLFPGAIGAIFFRQSAQSGQRLFNLLELLFVFAFPSLSGALSRGWFLRAGAGTVQLTLAARCADEEATTSATSPETVPKRSSDEIDEKFGSLNLSFL